MIVLNSLLLPLLCFIVISHSNPLGTYVSEREKSINITVKDKSLIIYKTPDSEFDMIVMGKIHYEGEYSIEDNQIIFDNGKCRLKIVSDDALISDFEMQSDIKRGDVFYCNVKHYYNGAKYIGQWSKGKKIGKWMFFNKNGNVTGIEYDDKGAIKDTFNVVIKKPKY
jgi:hypothetical protein